MKHTVLSFLFALLPLIACADAVEINGIYYNLVSKLKTAEVTNNPNKYTGSVDIPASVEYDGTTYSVTNIGEQAFYGCSGLTSITIPNSVTSIGNYAFYSCSGLTSVTIPNSVTSIGSEAFENCSGLTSITIPNSVTSIGNAAFYKCSGLKEVHISDLAAWCNISFLSNANPLFYAEHLYLNGTEITELTIPNSVTSIGNYAFPGCSGLTSVIIPNSVTSIGNYAFQGCSGLTSVSIPNSVTSVGRGAFMNCSGLKEVHISDLAAWCNISFGNSDANPLYHAHHLYLYENEITELAIPNSVTSIESGAFCNCSSLTSIAIPNSVTSIGKQAFENCSGLTSVTIPNSVTSIDYRAFQDCSSLTSIIIGSSIKTISINAFASCPELTDVYCFAESVPSADTKTFDSSYIEFSTLHVPESALEAYKAKVPWSSFKNFVSLEGGDQLYDMTVSVGSALGKVTYGTTDVTNVQQTFNVRGSENVVLTLTPNDGFKVSQVMVNGEDRTANVMNGVLTLGNLTANTTVSVSFGVAGEFTKVVIGSDKMATFCPLADADLSTLNLKAYTGGGFNRQTGVLTMMRVYDVPAGEGLLLKGEPGTYFVPYSKSYSVYSNLLKGVITATNLNATEGGYVNYVLSNGSQGVGFYKVGTAGASLEAGHAYLQILAETAASRGVLSLRFEDEDEATAIDATLVNSEERIVNSVLYDLQGRKVEKPQRGLYIRDGKKVVVK